jgi:hypothetical protein
MVEDYLAEHPDDSFGPAKIGRTSINQAAR